MTTAANTDTLSFTGNNPTFIRDMHSLVLMIQLIIFNDTASTQIYTLSLHDALPIWRSTRFLRREPFLRELPRRGQTFFGSHRDRKSTRLNSSHSQISYAVFCLKKKLTFTGNNVTFIRDMASRVVTIRLNTRLANGFV